MKSHERQACETVLRKHRCTPLISAEIMEKQQKTIDPSCEIFNVRNRVSAIDKALYLFGTQIHVRASVRERARTILFI